MLKITSLSKAYGKKQVLTDLNFEIAVPSIVHIKGTNGCGKTTLLKLIAGIEEADSGTIEVGNQVKIGALIENGSFIENRSLKFNIEYLLGIRKEETSDYAKQLCRLFHVDYEGKKKLKEFSIGMRQKAGIIQALMEKQNLILLDEPTRGMDEESVQIFCELMKKVKADNKIVIIASHEKLKDLSYDEIYVMEGGRIEKQG